MYQSTTRTISVAVKPIYLEDESVPENDYYVWAYEVHIRNQGAEPVQLLRRHWRITDAQGHVVEVDGDGVGGEQPVLKPGETFAYAGNTPLSTPYGIMGGAYRMSTEGGEAFDVEIPTFSLHSPFARRVLH
jgi:ApaG protein